MDPRPGHPCSGAMSAPLLVSHGLSKHLGGKLVVDGVNLECSSGEVVGLLGANGAGKSTTIRMCSGILRPDGGSVLIQGHDVHRNPDQALRHLGVCTQDNTDDSDLSVADNLRIMASYFRPRPHDLSQRVEELLDRFSLRSYAAARPDTLSGGYRRRLAMARALVHRPRLLYLDEPTTGLDPEARVALWELIRELRQEGLGIVLTTHYMDEANRLCDRLVVLSEGRIAAQGTAASILGERVGEHMIVINGQQTAWMVQVANWLQANRLPTPAQVMGDWHIAVDSTHLAAFSLAFGGHDFEVRKPTLDDLFIALALELRP